MQIKRARRIECLSLPLSQVQQASTRIECLAPTGASDITAKAFIETMEALIAAGMPEQLAIPYLKLLWRAGSDLSKHVSISQVAKEWGMKRRNFTKDVLDPLLGAGLVLKGGRNRAGAHRLAFPIFPVILHRIRSHWCRKEVMKAFVTFVKAFDRRLDAAQQESV